MKKLLLKLSLSIFAVSIFGLCYTLLSTDDGHTYSDWHGWLMESETKSLTTWQQAWKKREWKKLKAEGEDISDIGLPPKKPNDHFIRERMFPFDSIPEKKRIREFNRAIEMKHAASRQSRSLWVQEGPTNIPGRITSLAISPSNPDRIIAGAADGGMLRSDDNGVTWNMMTDNFPSLSIGALAVDPNDYDIIYLGTGESNPSSDSYNGVGLYKSNDGGYTWNFSGLENSYRIGRIVINPQNTNEIYVACMGKIFSNNPEKGIYKSTDGGYSWTQSFYLNINTSAIDVVIDPENPQVVYAAMWNRSGGTGTGIWKTEDEGESWTQLVNGLPSSAMAGRIGITLCQSDPSILYSIYADQVGYFIGVYKATDGGDSWSQVNDNALSDMYSSYGWWFGNIRVDPSNPDMVYALGLDIWKTSNGGNSWSNISGWNVHVDQHDFWINPENSSQVVAGNDGGIYVSNNGGNSWTMRYNQPTTQFYAIEVDNLQPQKLFGGTQDNGTLKTNTGNTDDWYEILGGDGFHTLVDYTNSNRVYAEYQFGNLYRSINGGESMNWAMSGIDSDDRRNWSTPVFFDPVDPSILYYGTYRLYRTTNYAGSWSVISNDLTASQNGTLKAISVSPLNPDIIYTGSNSGKIFRSLNYGNTWANVTSGLPERTITWVAADLFDEATVYVTISGYIIDEYLPHIYKSTDYGNSWESISSNLPEIPLNVVIQDPRDEDRLYVGSDLGVYITENSGESWEMLSSNLPNTAVVDLDYHGGMEMLYAGTHGRSIFSIDVSSSILPGDLDGDGQHTIYDIIRIINLILGLNPNPFEDELEAADINNDSIIDIFDVVLLVDLILNN